MSFNECCKNCKHCIPGKSSSHGWCALRNIKVHPDIAQFAFCHHWTQREPTLPALQKNEISIDKQLDFGKAFVNSDI